MQNRIFKNCGTSTKGIAYVQYQEKKEENRRTI